ncbi:MAG: hypothetical protein AB8H80_10795 [Planctomycetota bacterium]
MTPLDFVARAWRPALGLFAAFGLLLACSAPSAQEADVPPGLEVVQTMNSGGYTYVRVAGEQGPVWYAGQECEVAVGDRVEVTGDVTKMKNFKSRTLDRTFAQIYFVEGYRVVADSGR